jgi:hypothetical protein
MSCAADGCAIERKFDRREDERELNSHVNAAPIAATE